MSFLEEKNNYLYNIENITINCDKMLNYSIIGK